MPVKMFPAKNFSKLKVSVGAAWTLGCENAGGVEKLCPG
jgi:hypothetical protein